ncbi:MAG: HTH domain-containing protein, partial [Patescibacteria group bacterium]
GLSWQEMEKIFGRVKSTLVELLRHHQISKPRTYKKESDYTDAQSAIIKKYYESSVLVKSQEESSALTKAMIDAVNLQREKENAKLVTLNAIRCYIKQFSDLNLKWGWPQDKNLKSEQKTEESPPILAEQKYSLPDIIEANSETMDGSLAREGNFSRIDYKAQGFRRYLIRLEAERFAVEGCPYLNIDGGLVDKNYIQEEIKRRVKEYGPKFKQLALEHTIIAAARELASILPRIKKPNSQNQWVRYYIYPSLPFDGNFGLEIAQKLEEFRREQRDKKGNLLGGDIRVGKLGGERRLVKKVNKIHFHIVSRKNRLPSKYQSQFAEKEIEAREERTDKPYPDLYVVGCGASSIYVPDGIRKRPYITVGASHRLEMEAVGVGSENQSSITVVDYKSEEECLIRTWSFKDLIANERSFIKGIKEGATDLHRKIVEVIKKEGNRSAGEIADELNVDESVIEREIKFLLEEKGLSRKTWPGLWYNPHSQRYDFHLDWIQERLSCSLPKDGWREDTALIFGCLHAGYSTTDYQFVVQKFPEIILKRNVKIIRIVGDLIAGLHHDFLHTGEVIGGLNNTEQEELAAELLDTVFIKVLKVRMKKILEKPENKTITAENLRFFVEESLLSVVYIPGNHDLWQEKDGSTPLSVFRFKLKELLNKHIMIFLEESRLQSINLNEIIEKKLIGFPDYSAIYELPSGIKVEMIHPHLGRALTTSLRGQTAIKDSAAQEVDEANFHAAFIGHMWYPDRGQCVVIQAGCMLIGTRFEKRKLKGKLDFGPIFLRTRSREGRIWMTETAYYNRPVLKTPLPKSIDIPSFKHDLGLLDYV